MWIVVIMFLAVVIPIVVSHHLEFYRSHKNYSNGIANHDTNFREFVYRVDKSSDEIWQSLKCSNTYTATKYRFNEPDNTIVFYSELPDGYLDITYGIYVFEHEGYCILKVVQRNHFWEKNKYTLLQNEFWNQLLGAMPIPYRQ